MQQVAAIKGAINGLMSELMEQHLHHHVLKGAEVDQNELDEFLKVLKDTAEKVLDDIALYIIQFYYFPIQNEPKILPNRSSALKSPVISPKAFWARRSDSATSSPALNTTSCSRASAK